MSAYAQISADITKQIESVLFTEKEGEFKQYKKQQEKREEEIKRKESNLTAQIALKIQENESLREANIGLSNQINLLDKKRECLTVSYFQFSFYSFVDRLLRIIHNKLMHIMFIQFELPFLFIVVRTYIVSKLVSSVNNYFQQVISIQHVCHTCLQLSN